jgi:hypothetical protein
LLLLFTNGKRKGGKVIDKLLEETDRARRRIKNDEERGN